MWPYVATAIVAISGLWKLVAVLRCERQDIPKVANAIRTVAPLKA